MQPGPMRFGATNWYRIERICGRKRAYKVASRVSLDSQARLALTVRGVDYCPVSFFAEPVPPDRRTSREARIYFFFFFATRFAGFFAFVAFFFVFAAITSLLGKDNTPSWVCTYPSTPTITLACRNAY
jgi:hypothetical protein